MVVLQDSPPGAGGKKWKTMQTEKNGKILGKKSAFGTHSGFKVSCFAVSTAGKPIYQPCVI